VALDGPRHIAFGARLKISHDWQVVAQRRRGAEDPLDQAHVALDQPVEPTAVRSTTPWLPESFAGSPDAVAEHLEAYRRASLEYGICAFESEDLDDLLRQMRIFAEHVAPEFAAFGGPRSASRR